MLAVVCVIALSGAARAGDDSPAPVEGDYTIDNFRFESGESLPKLRMHYRTVGTPRRDAQGRVTNAVLILHGTTGSGANFIRPEFAGELFRKGGLLDAEKYYLILPDDIGHGKSSKPSDGLHAKFPRYRYRDMVQAEHTLVFDGLKVSRLRLVMGTSMGGMHTWMWGTQFSADMDALMPLACLPVEISGRNRMWRKMISDAIRHDPSWQNGDYKQQPASLDVAAGILYFMGSSPVVRYQECPTAEKADAALTKAVADTRQHGDANDILYAVEASGDYNPAPDLDKITAPTTAINFADDLINPPELGIFERETKRVRTCRAVLIPAGPATRGHGTHTLAAVWREHLAELLQRSEPHAAPGISRPIESNPNLDKNTGKASPAR